MQQKTATLFSFLSFVILAGSVGCSANPELPPERLPGKRFAGVTIRVACPDELTGRILTESSQGWASRVGATVELRRYDPEKNEPPDSGADLWILEALQLPLRASAGALLPLPEAITAKEHPFDWSGLLGPYRRHLLVWDSAAHAVPLLGDAPVCFFRKDLFDDPNHRREFAARHTGQLAPPATWDDFATLAEYFQQARTGDRNPRSLPALPENDRELDRLFYTVAASFARRAVGLEREAGKPVTREDQFSFHFDEETGQPRIAGAGFVHALKLLQRLQPFRPAGKEKEPWRAFADGRAVLCIGDVRLLGMFQANGLDVQSKVGVCQVPGHRGWYDFQSGQLRQPEKGGVNRVPYLGEGTFVLAVPRASQQFEAAFDLLTYLGGRTGSEQIVREPAWGGGATRRTQLEEDWAGFRLNAVQARELQKALRRTLEPPPDNPVLVLRIPRERAFRVPCVERLRAALDSGKAATEEGAAAVLRTVAVEWEKQIGTQSAEHLRAYRASLGLR